MKKEDLIGLHFTCGSALYYFTEHSSDDIISIGYKDTKNYFLHLIIFFLGSGNITANVSPLHEVWD